MKIVFFLIIIIIVYILALQIKVVHIKSLPEQDRNELKMKSKLKEIMYTNSIKSKNKLFNNYQNRYDLPVRVDLTNSDTLDINDLPDVTNLIELIKNEFVDSDFKFNISNLPVTTQNCNKFTCKNDKYIVKNIREYILKWNELFDNNPIIKILEIKPIFIMKTEREFFVKSFVKLFYNNRSLHLEVVYYAESDKGDDYDSWSDTSYTLYLNSIRPILKADYVYSIEKIESIEKNNFGPFQSLSDQLKYVKKINEKHKNDFDI